MDKTQILRSFTLVGFFICTTCVWALAQCTPILSGPDFEALPDTVVNIPTAYYPSTYEATLQMYIPTDTFVDMLQLVLPLDSLFITGIDGLPPSFEYEVYPSAGPIPGGIPICIQITNDLVYEKVAGSYPLYIHVTAWSVGLPANGDITGYVLNVEPLSVGVPEHEVNVIRSNMIDGLLQLNFKPTEPVYIIGSDGRAAFQFKPAQTLDVSFLSNGVYLIRTELGSSIFIKQ